MEALEIVRYIQGELVKSHRFWTSDLRDTAQLHEDVSRRPQTVNGYLRSSLEQRFATGHLAANYARDLIGTLDTHLGTETPLESIPGWLEKRKEPLKLSAAMQLGESTHSYNL